MASCWVMVEPPTSFGCAQRGRRPRGARRRAGSSPLGALLGALVALPGPLDRVPFDAAVLGEAGVLAGDHRALQVSANARRSRPSAGSSAMRCALGEQAPGLAALEGGRLRVDQRHQRDAQRRSTAAARARRAASSATKRQACADAGIMRRRAPAARAAPAAPARSCGRTPRQTKNASAACSTSMPRPSRPRAPCALRPGEEGSAAAPYIRSTASAPGAARAAATGTRGAVRLLALRVDHDVEAARRSRRAPRACSARRAGAQRAWRSTSARGLVAACGWPPRARRGRASSSGPSTPAAAPPAPTSSTRAPAIGTPALCCDVAHQADAVGVVGEPAVGVEAQHVGRLRQRGARR